MRGDPLATDQSQPTSHRYLAFYHLAPRTLPPPVSMQAILSVQPKNSPGVAQARKNDLVVTVVDFDQFSISVHLYSVMIMCDRLGLSPTDRLSVAHIIRRGHP